MDDISKLPKWAQSRIKVLENENEFLRQQIEATSSGNSPIRWLIGLDCGDYKGIPEYATLYFGGAGRNYKLYATYREGQLRVYTSCGGLIVLPNTSNSVYLKPER